MGQYVEQHWRKSSLSEGACAEAAVLDLTIQGDRIVGFDPVLRAGTADAGTSRSAETPVARDALVGRPTTQFDAWNAFAAWDPRSANDLLAATRQKIARLEGAAAADQSWDDAIKAAYTRLTEDDRSRPLLTSQADRLSELALAGHTPQMRGGVPGGEVEWARIRYSVVNPSVEHLVERLELSDAQLYAAAQPGDPYGFLLAERDAQGRLTSEAVQSYVAGQEAEWRGHLERIRAGGSVLVEGVSDDQIRSLPSSVRARYPELESYLHQARHVGGHTRVATNPRPVSMPVQVGAVTVVFHRQGQPDPVVDRAQAVVVQAASDMQARGYTFSSGRVDVHIPTYSRQLTVQADADGEVVVRSAQIGGVPSFAAVFVPPGSLMISTAHFRDYGPGERPYSLTTAEASTAQQIDHRNLASSLAGHAYAIAVHELGHQAHFSADAARYVDLVSTGLRQAHHIEATGHISPYAGWNALEFVAEYLTAVHLGLWIPPAVRDVLAEVYIRLGGPVPAPTGVSPRAPELTIEEAEYLADRLLVELRRRGDPGAEGVVPELIPVLHEQLELFDRWLLHDDRVAPLANLFAARADVGASSSPAAGHQEQQRETRPLPRARVSYAVGPGPEQASTSRGPQQARPGSDAVLERYRTVAPSLAPYVERAPIDDLGSDVREVDVNPRNPLHYLVADARAGSGELSEGAIRLFESGREHFLMNQLRDMAGARISVIGLTDDELRALTPAQLALAPELTTYLHRGNREASFDVNDTLAVHTRRFGNLTINFRRSAYEDPLADQRESMVMRALRHLEAAGFEMPGGVLEVHLPRYSAPMTVRRNRPSASNPSPITVDDRDPGDARFVAPHHIFLPPHSGVEYPVGLRPQSESSAQGIYSEVAEASFVAMLHELVHFLHYRRSPQRYADLVQALLRPSEDLEVQSPRSEDLEVQSPRSEDLEVQSPRSEDLEEPNDHPDDLSLMEAISNYAGHDLHEFVAEFITALLLGKPFDPVTLARLHELNRAFGGPEPHSGTIVPVEPPALTSAEVEVLVRLVTRNLHHTGSAVVPTPENVIAAYGHLTTYERWSHLSARSEAIAGVVAAHRDTLNAQAGPSRSAGSQHDRQVFMADTSDSMRNGLRQALEEAEAAERPDLATIERLRTLLAAHEAPRSVGSTATARAGGSALGRAVPVASLDVVPRGFGAPTAEVPDREPVAHDRPVDPPGQTHEQVPPAHEDQAARRSYGVDAAPPGIGWTAARWVRSWDMTLVPGGSPTFLDAVLAGAGGAVTVDGAVVRGADGLREELAAGVRADTRTSVEQLTWWPAAAEAYHAAMSRAVGASGHPDTRYPIEWATAVEDLVAVVSDPSPRPMQADPRAEALVGEMLPHVVSAYLGRGILVVRPDGQVAVYGRGAGDSDDSTWIVVVEALDGHDGATAWAAAVQHGTGPAFGGLSGRQVAWAAAERLRFVGDPLRGTDGTTFLGAAGAVLASDAHRRLVEAVGETLVPATVDGTVLEDAASAVGGALRVVFPDGTVRVSGDGAPVTLAVTGQGRWVALASVRGAEAAGAATRVADVAGAPSVRVVEDPVQDDHLVALPVESDRAEAERGGAAMLSPAQRRWALSHGREVSAPQEGGLAGAVLRALGDGVTVGDRVVTDPSAVREAVVAAVRADEADTLDLWLRVYSVYGDLVRRRREQTGEGLDALALATEIDTRVNSGAARDDIVRSITDPTSWPELADAVTPFLLSALGVAVRVVHTDGSVDRYGQGRAAYVARPPQGANVTGLTGWAALVPRAARFPATSVLGTSGPDNVRGSQADLTRWLDEHAATQGAARRGPDAFFDAVLEAVGGRLLADGLDATTAAELRADLGARAVARSGEPLPAFARATYTFESEARIVENYFDGTRGVADPRAVHEEIAGHVRSGDAWHYIAQALTRPGEWDAITTALAPALLAERAGLDLLVVDGARSIRYGVDGGTRVVLSRTADLVPVWSVVRPGGDSQRLAAVVAATPLVDTRTAVSPVQHVDPALEGALRASAGGQDVSVLRTASGRDAFYAAVLAAVGGGLVVERGGYVSTPQQLRATLARLVTERADVLTPEAVRHIEQETGLAGAREIGRALQEDSQAADVVGAHLAGPYLGVELRVLGAEIATASVRGRRVVLARQTDQDGAVRWTALADRGAGVTEAASRLASPVQRARSLSLNQSARRAGRAAHGFQRVAPGQKVSEAGWHKSSYSGDHCVVAAVVALAAV